MGAITGGAVTARIGRRVWIIGAAVCIPGALIPVVAHDSVLVVGPIVVGMAIGVAS
jgi:hypothetical protein